MLARPRGRGRARAHAGSVVGIIGADGRVAALQCSGGGGWRAWGRQATELAALHARGSGPALFAIARDIVWHTCEAWPASAWTDWISLGGPLGGMQAEVIPNGQLWQRAGVFAIGEDGEVYHAWSERREGPWTAWELLDHEPMLSAAADHIRGQEARGPSS